MTIHLESPSFQLPNAETHPPPSTQKSTTTILLTIYCLKSKQILRDVPMPLCLIWKVRSTIYRCLLSLSLIFYCSYSNLGSSFYSRLMELQSLRICFGNKRDEYILGRRWCSLDASCRSLLARDYASDCFDPGAGIRHSNRGAMYLVGRVPLCR